MRRGTTRLKEPFLHERFKELVAESMCSYHELADFLKVNEIYLRMIARGKRKPSNQLLEQICKAFDCRPDYLTGISDERTMLP